MSKTKNSKDSKNNNSKTEERLSTSTTESNTDPSAKGTFGVGRFFVKKMGFDGSAATDLLNNKEPMNSNPNIKIELNVMSVPLKDSSYEVDLFIKATGTLDGKPLFEGSVEQAGIFIAKDFSAQQLDYLLKSYCPSLLFPYARENIANAMVRGGLKPLELPAIDFAAAYQAAIQEQTSKKL